MFDYTWKQNRLSKDKEALKNSVMNVIRKKPVEKKHEEPAKVISGGQTPMIQPSNQAQAYGERSPGIDQGYSAIKR